MERRLWRTTLRACRWSQAVWSSHSTRTRLVRMPLVHKRSTFLPRMSSRCWPSLCRRTPSVWCWDRVTEVQDAWPVIHPDYTVQVSPVHATDSEEHDMSETTEYVHLFDDTIKALFSDAVRIMLQDPSVAAFFVRMRRAQHRAERRRALLAAEGVHVPPFMIISVTGRCNLACAGCYAQAQQRHEEPDMTPTELLSVVRQGHDLGVGIMLLAGGEPMTRVDDLLTIAREVPDVVFPVFTNGTLLDDLLVRRIRKQRNVVPVISLEGHEAATDARRGSGCRREGEGSYRAHAQGRHFLRHVADSHSAEHQRCPRRPVPGWSHRPWMQIVLLRRICSGTRGNRIARSGQCPTCATGGGRCFAAEAVAWLVHCIPWRRGGFRRMPGCRARIHPHQPVRSSGAMSVRPIFRRQCPGRAAA